MFFSKKGRRIAAVLIVAGLLLGAASLYYLRTSKSELAMSVRRFVKERIMASSFEGRPELTEGYKIKRETIYVDGKAGAHADEISGHDVKVMYDTTRGKLFCDYANGFSLLLPADAEADVTKSPGFVAFESPEAKIVVSREWTYDKDVSGYIEYYFYRFLLDEDYRSQNGIRILERTKTDSVELLIVQLDGYNGKFDTYAYIDFLTGTQIFFHVMIKYSSEGGDGRELVQEAIDTFKYFQPEGTAVYTTDYRPQIPENWTEETRQLYESMVCSEELLWGIYVHNIKTVGIEQDVPQLEQKLGYKFGLVLAYAGLDEGFPTSFMERCYSEGRIVELTLQATESFNVDLYTRSPWLELYKKGDDWRIREFARAAKEFGKPFLLRLNNEMNSDWVSYGGVVNLLDPDIFVENWRTIYRIFQEEGVNNAIWIFNPNDRDAPPNSWNCQAAYYPGNEYVQIFGVTGYNNGTYYKDTTGEYWRKFETIYDKIEADSAGIFGEFPWMITEFSSSSIGGDKAKWIENMFASLWKYPRIKAAVWFSSVDYDPKDNKTPARPYWLDETEQTLEAFRQGLISTGALSP